MEGILWLVLLCLIAATVLAAMSLCRRMLSQDLPERMITAVVLDDLRDLGVQLRALAAQITWMDSAFTTTIWLVDATPDGSLRPICMAFCRRHPMFRYCRMTELEKILGNPEDDEKNDCNLSGNHV